MPTWYNSDGLLIKYGPSESTGRAGEYRTQASERVIEFALNLVDVGVTNGGTFIDDNVQVPKGALIKRVEVETVTAVTGASATLNFGLSRTDRTTELDYDGLGKAAALTTTAMATKGTILTFITGTSNAGALIGTALANNGILVADYDTAAFTAGRINVRITYEFPL